MLTQKGSVHFLKNHDFSLKVNIVLQIFKFALFSMNFMGGSTNVVSVQKEITNL